MRSEAVATRLAPKKHVASNEPVKANRPFRPRLIDVIRTPPVFLASLTLPLIRWFKAG